jgi:copper chaperone CopZ
MKYALFVFTSILLSTSCTIDKKSVVIRKESRKMSTSGCEVDANRMLTMEVSGMTCVMGCGASIRKELFATKAVSSVEFDFEKGRATNLAKIAFDKDKVTVDQIVQLISSLNSKQFTIGKTSSQEFSCPTNKASCISNSKCSYSTCKEEVSMNTTESGANTLNFLSLLSRFLIK